MAEEFKPVDYINSAKMWGQSKNLFPSYVESQDTQFQLIWLKDWLRYTCLMSTLILSPAGQVGRVGLVENRASSALS